MTATRLLLASGLLMSSAAFAVPPALDRVPSDATMVMVVPNLRGLSDAMSTLGEQFNIPMEDGPGKFTEMLDWPGVNADGSAAIALLGEMNAGEEEGQEPFVAIVPVTDYRAFVTKFGGKGAGVEKLDFDGDEVFAKDLGGGFAVFGPVETIVSSFAGAAGQGAGHEARAGKGASAMLDTNDIVVLLNVEKVRPIVDEALDNAAGQADMMGQGEAFGAMQVFAGQIMDDATAAAFGMDYGTHGLTLNMGAQFKPGSKWAAYSDVKANAASLFSKVPSKPFLFAFAMDTSSPTLKGMFKDLMGAFGQGDEAGVDTNLLLSNLDKADGTAIVIGNPAAGLMGGGFLLNSSSFIATRDSAGYLAAMKKVSENMNGKTVEGVTYQTTYKTGAATVNGTKVDEWSMRMRMDPDAADGGQAQQMQMMLFGPAGGPGGYSGAVPGGVVMTYGKNSTLMQEAMQAASGGANLSTDAGISTVSQHLTQGRLCEGYVGIKSIMDMALPMMGMMMGPVEFEVPASLPPVGFSGTASGGGVHLALVVPADVLTMFRDFSKAMEAAQGDPEMDGEVEDDAGQPRF